MKNRMAAKGLGLAVGLGTGILVAIGGGGCATSHQEHHANEATHPAVDPATRGDVREVSPEREAAMSCRTSLRRINSAKLTWALEHRKPESEIPVDADLFGSGGYLPAKPKCPSGGAYTLRAVGEVPQCSVAGHTY